MITPDGGRNWPAQYKNGGRECRAAGDREKVKVHDFVDRELGRANPYGVDHVAAETAGSAWAPTQCIAGTNRTGPHRVVWVRTAGGVRPRGPAHLDLISKVQIVVRSVDAHGADSSARPVDGRRHARSRPVVASRREVAVRGRSGPGWTGIMCFIIVVPTLRNADIEPTVTGESCRIRRRRSRRSVGDAARGAQIGDVYAGPVGDVVFDAVRRAAVTDALSMPTIRRWGRSAARAIDAQPAPHPKSPTTAGLSASRGRGWTSASDSDPWRTTGYGDCSATEPGMYMVGRR